MCTALKDVQTPCLGYKRRALLNWRGKAYYFNAAYIMNLAIGGMEVYKAVARGLGIANISHL